MGDCLKINETLIDFEFGGNNFRLEDIRKIQDLLRRNKAKYDEDRLREWRERKQMSAEDTQLQKLYLEQDTRQEQVRMEEEAKDSRSREIDRIWKAMEQE